jgi:hypothetical protein
VIFRRPGVAHESSPVSDERRRLLTFGVGGDVFLLEVIRAAMSFADLNDENSEFKHPEKAASVEDIVRVYGGLTPNAFFNELVRVLGPYRSLQADLERAIFLYQQMRRAHRALWRWALSSVVILLAPLVCLVAPSEWRFSTFFIGILGELLAVFALLRIHQKWVSCRRDYTRWLRLVHRRVGERES